MSAREPSLEPSGDAVKEPKGTPSSRGANDRRATGFARLFEGWQLGAIVVALVLSAALLAVPRAAQPGIFPIPALDETESRLNRERYARLADLAEREGLPFETRAVGDAVRRFGVALASGGDAEHAVVRARGAPARFRRSRVGGADRAGR
jgi:hypothetical protein